MALFVIFMSIAESLFRSVMVKSMTLSCLKAVCADLDKILHTIIGI